MAKLYLLGGENTFKRDAQNINQKAFQDAGGSPEVLVFPWARPSFDNIYSRRKRLVDYFRSLGASSVSFAEYLEDKDAIKEKISSSDLIYLTGGRLSVLVERLRIMNVDVLLPGYRGVIVGRSAGALVLCKKCVVTGQKKKTKVASGFGLTDFMLKTHYTNRNDLSLAKLSEQEVIYAVPQASALVVDNRILSSIGPVFLFSNGQKSQLNA